MPFEKFQHNGKTILHNDLRGAVDPEVGIAVLDRFEEAILATPGKVLVLDDVTDAKGSTAFMNRAKEAGKKYDHRVEKEAVVGATGVKKVMLQAYLAFTGHQTMKTFDAREEALEWLTS